uniref:Uncharacterized protein n=1 Tax=Arundo donax TaxID=35708 RepID=A0A0A9BM25_ARUDO
MCDEVGLGQPPAGCGRCFSLRSPRNSCIMLM